jgi:Uma2 family endonuclease
MRLSHPAPLLVVEVVSNSETAPQSRVRDYQEERLEYAARGISEYWIIELIADVILSFYPGGYAISRTEVLREKIYQFSYFL